MELDPGSLGTRKAPGGMPTRRPGLRTFQGLGPRSRWALATLGITTPEQPAQHDPLEVDARLKVTRLGVSLKLLHALIGVVEPRHGPASTGPLPARPQAT
jgi:hypothetical protein